MRISDWSSDVCSSDLDRRNKPARVLSGGERRLLEISRALVMEPDILLVDEPSIGLEPRFIDMVFENLGDLQATEHKTIVMVEQNAQKGLEFAALGSVLVSGPVGDPGPAAELLPNHPAGPPVPRGHRPDER